MKYYKWYSELSRGNKKLLSDWQNKVKEEEEQ